MTRRARLCRIAQLASATALAMAPASLAQPPAQVRQVFSSDSVAVRAGALSPDGRWVLLVVPHAQGTALWVAPAAGGAPVRLTSDGYVDDTPVWFLSGDRIAFTSNRANRNGERRSYVMVLRFDRETGRALGVPQQISSEPVRRNGFASADGRWITYVTTVNGTEQLNLIPTSGGTPKILVSGEPVIGAMHFNRAGTHVYYSGSFMEGSRRIFTLKRVPVTGGPPEILARTDHAVRILPADDRFLVHTVSSYRNAGLRFEVRTREGKTVASTTMPAGIDNPIFSGDGWQLMGVRRPWTATIHVVSTDGRENRVVVKGGAHWPEAWMHNDSLITDRHEAGKVYVEIHPLAGGAPRQVVLPATQGQTGWNESVGPYLSSRNYPSPSLGLAGYVLSATDLRTGTTRQLSTKAVGALSFEGRGGMENDGPNWIIAEQNAPDGPVDLRSIDPATGTSRVLRTFPPGSYPERRQRIAVHGDRIAWVDQQRDSLYVVHADGGGAVRRSGGWKTDYQPEYRPTWSWGGDKVAVPMTFGDGDSRVRVFVLDIPRGGEPARERVYQAADLGFCEGTQWLPGDGALVMLCWKGPIPLLVRLGLADGQFTTLATGNANEGPWEFLTSPDGRFLSYPMQTWRGSTVSVLNLKPLLPKAP